jgi:MFS family permease
MHDDEEVSADNGNHYAGAAAAIIAASILPTITITPILPRIQAHFSAIAQIDVLVQLIYALPALLSLLVAPYVGAVSDRLGRREIIIGSCILATLLGITPYFLESIWMIIGSRALLGVFQGTLIVCTSALIADYFVERRREQILGLKFGVVGIANIALLIAVGYVSVANWRNGFLLYLFGGLATLLVVAFIKTPPHRRILASAEKVVIDWRPLIAPFVGSFLGAASFTLLFSQLPFLLQAREISSSPAFAGNVTSITSAGMFIAAFSYSTLIRRTSGMVLWSATFSFVAVGFAVAALNPLLPGIIAGAFLGGLGTGLVMPNSLNMVLARVPATARGKAAGFQTTCFFLGIFGGPLIGVSLSRALGGPAQSIAAWAFIALIASGVFLLRSRVKASSC